MKISAIIVLLLAFAVSAHAQKKGDLMGTWQFASGKYGDSPEYIIPKKQGKFIKIISATHFCNISITAEGLVKKTAGGIYSLKGNEYTESIDFTSAINEMQTVGTKSILKIEIKNDELHITGSMYGGTVPLKEIWKKVKQ